MARDAAALAIHAQRALAYRRAHPDRVAARVAVREALKRGVLTRPDSCGRCGVACKPEASHTDYARQLDVEWLCRRCHEDKDLSTHCKNGHEMTPENSVWITRPIGRQRKCRACARMWTREYRQRTKESTPARPKLCRNRLHEMTPSNSMPMTQRGTVVHRCRECWRATQRAYKARVRQQGVDRFG